MKTRKTENGSTYRVPVPSEDIGTGCADDMKWLQGVLMSRGLKAYRADISVRDPKQRRPSNEVTDWCKGAPLKLWNTNTREYMPSVEVQYPASMARVLLKSVPTGLPPQ